VTDELPRLLRTRLGEVLPTGWRDLAPWGYPQQAQLALVAGVFRAQTPQSSVDWVVDTVMRARPHSMLDDLADFANGDVADVVEMLGPRWGDTNVLGVPVLRAKVIFDAACALVDLGVRSSGDLRDAAVDRPDAVEAAVLGVRGLGPATWEWIALFCHARVRPDAEMVALVSELVEAASPLSVDDTVELLTQTARVCGTQERTLTHAVRVYLDARIA